MRYEPYQDEYDAVPTMTDEELLEYFLYRILETDEVWGLKDGPQWMTRNIDGMQTLPVWPFKRFAAEAAIGEWQHLKPAADAMEFFIYRTLNNSARQGLTIEIMPRSTGKGCLISPQRLLTILEGTMHSGEYTLED
ncbi:DUF2750 domain-containing protein [Methylomonas sp. SURF-2]|uniref:DUF2750 domain-containing protein n=1 Tax=Methylomonas subterranea TaxID=2952225 RepID=A0ABT1TH18_9GAMM|nr:DUF2750 domain-containing protein [Methylomonas sp. SURF-2]MCQ8104730.1 DUF2750 domain-containing protein [Methylomonas sp. SURF-2]